MRNTGLPTHRRYDGERRGDSRTDLRRPARLVHDEGAIDGEIENISASGAGFSTRVIDPELAEGTRVVLRASIQLPEGERKLERRGSVVRSEDFFDGEDDVMTYAIEFDEPLTDDCFIDAD